MHAYIYLDVYWAINKKRAKSSESNHGTLLVNDYSFVFFFPQNNIGWSKGLLHKALIWQERVCLSHAKVQVSHLAPSLIWRLVVKVVIEEPIIQNNAGHAIVWGDWLLCVWCLLYLWAGFRVWCLNLWAIKIWKNSVRHHLVSHFTVKSWVLAQHFNRLNRRAVRCTADINLFYVHEFINIFAECSQVRFDSKAELTFSHIR